MGTHRNSVMGKTARLLLVAMALAMAVGATSAPETTDVAVAVPPPYDAEEPTYSGVERTSRDLTMRDGAEIVDWILAQPWSSGEVGSYGTSYLFRKGHSIRLALAGADRDHFALIPSEGPPTWTVLRDAAHPSHIALPVMRE